MPPDPPCLEFCMLMSTQVLASHTHTNVIWLLQDLKLPDREVVRHCMLSMLSTNTGWYISVHHVKILHTHEV